MSVKEQAIETIRAMPENVTWPDLAERVQLIAAVERGREEIRQGRGVPHPEARQRIASCLQKLSGHPAH
jgi:predicted transcriptional regulator